MSSGSISIRQALKNVASENYDKTNIFYYFLLFFATSLLSLFIPENPKTNELPVVGMFMLCSFSLSLIINGICTIASHNAIHRERGVFPNPLKEIGQIFIVSLSCLLGCLIWTLAMLVITALFMFPLLFVNKIVAILVSAIPLLCLTTLFIGAYFNFLISLSLSDWFDFKKVCNFMKEAKSYFLSYFIETCKLSLIFVLLSFVLVPINNPKIIMFFHSIFGFVFSVYMVDLTAQFVRKVKKMDRNIIKDKKIKKAGI